jgi:FixJ family two-component response regulator
LLHQIGLPQYSTLDEVFFRPTRNEARRKKFWLTTREVEIVSAVVAGHSNREIAEYFKISDDTLKHGLWWQARSWPRKRSTNAGPNQRSEARTRRQAAAAGQEETAARKIQRQEAVISHFSLTRA